jgi:hypothetical protein
MCGGVVHSGGGGLIQVCFAVRTYGANGLFSGDGEAAGGAPCGGGTSNATATVGKHTATRNAVAVSGHQNSLLPMRPCVIMGGVVYFFPIILMCITM